MPRNYFLGLTVSIEFAPASNDFLGALIFQQHQVVERGVMIMDAQHFGLSAMHVLEPERIHVHGHDVACSFGLRAVAIGSYLRCIGFEAIVAWLIRYFAKPFWWSVGALVPVLQRRPMGMIAASVHNCMFHSLHSTCSMRDCAHGHLQLRLQLARLGNHNDSQVEYRCKLGAHDEERRICPSAKLESNQLLACQLAQTHQVVSTVLHDESFFQQH